MANLVDSLDYMFPELSGSVINHLYDITKNLPVYVYPNIQSKRIWQIKSDKGFPWDMNTWDDSYIYQVYTEGPNGWMDVNSYKGFINNGIIWCPRHINPGDNIEIIDPDSTYKTYSANLTPTTQNLGGPIKISAEIVKGIDFGGNINIQDALVQRYYWGKDFANMEVNCYVMTWGHVRWQLFSKLTNGLYKLVDTSLYNTLKPGGVPQLVLPNGITP